jgi:hypothetical protein
MSTRDFIRYPIVAFLACASAFAGQTTSRSHVQASPGTQSSKLSSVLKMVQDSQVTETDWDLVFGQRNPNYKAKSPEEAWADIETFTKTKPLRDEYPGQVAEYQQVMKHLSQLRMLFKEPGLTGRHLSGFLYTCTDSGYCDIPIRFCLLDGALAILLRCVASEMVYNTLETTPKSRAAKVVESSILPFLNNFNTAFSGSDVRYYGIVVLYGSRDFSDNADPLNLKPEMVALVVPSEKSREFSGGKITDQQLVDSSVVFVHSRETFTDVQRVKLSLQ